MSIGRLLGDTVSCFPFAAGPVDHVREICRRLRYRDWVRKHDTLSRQDLVELRSAARMLGLQPTISVLMPVYNASPVTIETAIRSVVDQAYTHWELCIVGDEASASGTRELLQQYVASDPRITGHFRDSCGNVATAANTALEMATGDFVALLNPQDVLPSHALYWVAEAINRNPIARLLYSDEDKIDGRGRRFQPNFRPDFNYELFLSQNMVCHLGVYRREMICSLGGFRCEFDGSHDYDLTLRVVAAISRSQIVHIPRILYHCRAIASSDAPSRAKTELGESAGRRAVAEHLQVCGGGTVDIAPEAPSYNRIRYAQPVAPPLVSIVICTRDHCSLLRKAVESIRIVSTYPNYEILIVDNGSREPQAVAYLASLASQPGIRVFRDDSPFNYSRLNNGGVAHCRGDIVCLLNDDIEVITPDWIEEMVSFAMKPDIGAVGAKLWYPDGTLQHGGVIIGIGGVAGHAHPRLKKGHQGYFGRAVVQQELSAVTGACLMVRRAVYEEVGGLDEKIAVAFNDVDLCLRLRAAGYRNIWTPFAELIHHESVSRGREDNPEKIARFQREVRFMHERWGEVLMVDPHYNPNLTMQVGNYSLDYSPPHTAKRAA
jgi:glycosyltransferase involved in cell wall biosynthesis